MGFGEYPHTTLNYILRTGSNWSGPIKKLHLIINKGSQSDLVSLCWNGIKRTSPTRFEAIEENFVQKKDLTVLFVFDPDTHYKKEQVDLSECSPPSQKSNSAPYTDGEYFRQL